MTFQLSQDLQHGFGHLKIVVLAFPGFGMQGGQYPGFACVYAEANSPSALPVKAHTLELARGWERKQRDDTGLFSSVSVNNRTRNIQVALAPVFHLFPSRTEKLSPGAPMVLHRNAGE